MAVSAKIRDELAYGASLKIQRAKHHINDLNGRINAYLSEKPFKLILHHKPKAGETILRTKTEKPIPDEFGLIIGDAVHNLRSALDLTIYAMVSPRAPTSKLHKIEFPFPWDPKGIDRAIDEGQVRLAGEKVADAIRDLKPYETGNTLLWGLRSLDNRDKHRLILLTGKTASMTANELRTIIQGHALGPGRLEFRTEDADLIHMTNIRYTGLTRIQRRRMADFDQVTEVQPTFSICLRKGQPFDGDPIVSVLLDFTAEAERAINKLIDAFIDPANKFPC